MILGIDCGQTALKAVLFDGSGREVGVGRVATTVSRPQAHAAERDMAELVDQLGQAIRAALVDANLEGDAVSAVGIVAHGDGIYPVDADGLPTRPAFLALDSRSGPILRRWADEGILERAVELTGQHPHAGSQVAVAGWWREHDPQTLARTRWMLYCKDWLRYSLTGEIATDSVEASSCVGAIDGRNYAPEALAAYGLPELLDLLPPVREPGASGGRVSAAAAARTGLAPGTPVVMGTHDVVASALGAGASRPGDWCVQAGTYSVNQLIDDQRVVDPRWQARPWVVDGQWVDMGASASSASNLDWFLQHLMSGVDDPLGVANADVESLAGQPSTVLFHPFLSGSPYGPEASGSFLGVRSWHTRAHMVRAVFEGVVMNHRYHLDGLLGRATRSRVRLAGGVTRSEVWCQLFADALNCEVVVTDTSEHGALGAAMLAGIASGLWPSVDAAVAACVRTGRSYLPDGARRHHYDELYARYLHSIEVMRELWPSLESAADMTDSMHRVDADGTDGATSTEAGLLEFSTVLDYLADRGLTEPEDAGEVTELDGGISNTVLAVEAGGHSWVIKQSLPRLRVAQEWIAKQERTLNEARGLRVAHLLTPTHVPHVVDVDPDRFVLVLERAPRALVPLKKRLMAGEVDQATFDVLGRVLGHWHACTIADPSHLAGLDDPEAFEQLRISPYHRAAAHALPAAAADILAVATRMSQRRIALVHGDFSPKNILTGPGDDTVGNHPDREVWVLDFEVAHAGDPDFDVAFLLSHLVLKSVHLPDLRPRLEEAARTFMLAYGRAAGPHAQWRSAPGDTVTHVGALLLARTDGKSPAEYLTAPERRAVRTMGLLLVKPLAPDAALGDVVTSIWSAIPQESPR